jgi:hypothetical protein
MAASSAFAAQMADLDDEESRFFAEHFTRERLLVADVLEVQTAALGSGLAAALADATAAKAASQRATRIAGVLADTLKSVVQENQQLRVRLANIEGQHDTWTTATRRAVSMTAKLVRDLRAEGAQVSEPSTSTETGPVAGDMLTLLHDLVDAGDLAKAVNLEGRILKAANVVLSNKLQVVQAELRATQLQLATLATRSHVRLTTI